MDLHYFITYSTELVDGSPVYVSSNSLPVKALNFEPAGQAFHLAACKLLGCFQYEEEPVTEEERASCNKEQARVYKSSTYRSKNKVKSGINGNKTQDHYALLGLGHLRYLATEDQIRRSYREVALKYHPDKQAAALLTEESESLKQTKKEQIDTHFRCIQEAYDVLIDPQKRRVYDSTDEFDDEVPSDCLPCDFFKVFGAAFARNGRWSVNQPVPLLGDDDTPMDEVERFYDFWYAFKSWREFPHADEYDLEQAESRDHRRWMERQNAKLSEKARKDEYIRIRSLVDNAHRRDPRIVRKREEEKAEKARKKEAKVLAKRMQEEESVRLAEEQRRHREEEEKRALEASLLQKKDKEKEKKLLRKERARLRCLAAPLVQSSDEVETLCATLCLDEMKQLREKLDGEKDLKEQLEILTSACQRLHRKEEENGCATEGRSAGINGTVLSSSGSGKRLLGKEEVELLRKAMGKYPKGTPRRWEVISEYMGTGRSVEEILKATKTILLQKPDPSGSFNSFLEKRKPAPSISSPLTTRDAAANGLQPPFLQAPEGGNVEDMVGHSNAENDEWSPVQEKALVQALKTFPKEVGQRWERVAAAVPGKTVNQCKKRFGLLKENFRNKKVSDK